MKFSDDFMQLSGTTSGGKKTTIYRFTKTDQALFNELEGRSYTWPGAAKRIVMGKRVKLSRGTFVVIINNGTILLMNSNGSIEFTVKFAKDLKSLSVTSKYITGGKGTGELISSSRIPDEQTALIYPVSGFKSIEPFRNKVRSWSNRDYVWSDIPTNVTFGKFARTPGDDTTPLVFTVKNSGYVYVIDRVHPGTGWTSTGTYCVYTDKSKSKMTIYKRRYTPGKYSIKQNGWAGPVLLIP